MAVIGINYTEPDPNTYESVQISYGKDEEKIFDSGDFVKDWYELNKWITMEADGELKQEYAFSNSSSVNHFIMDGAPYISRYLKIDDSGNPLLVKDYDWMDEGTEFFIPDGKDWTWEELKKYCK